MRTAYIWRSLVARFVLRMLLFCGCCSTSLAEEISNLLADSKDPLPAGAIQRFGSSRFHVNGLANQVAFSGDGKLIFVQSGSELLVMDRESGRLIDDVRFHPGRGSLWKIASSADGIWLAVAITDFKAGPDESYRVVVMNTQSKRRNVLRSSGRRSHFHFLKFSPDKKTIVAGTDHDGLRFWNLETGDEILRPEITNEVIYAAAFSPDSQSLAAMTTSGLILWKWRSDDKPHRLVQNELRPSSLEFSPDGKWIFAGYHAVDGLRVFDVAKGELIWTLEPHKKYLNSVSHMAFTSDSRYIAVPVTLANTVDLWDIQQRRKVNSFHCWRPTTVAISKDERWLIAGGEGSKITVFDFVTHRPVNIMPDVHDHWISRIRFTQDGRSLVSASFDGSVIVWDIQSGKPTATMTHGLGNLVTGLALSNDGSRIVTMSANDQVLRSWNRTDHRYVVTHKHQLGGFSSSNEVHFSPDGHRFATWKNGQNLSWWNADDGKLNVAHPIKLPDVDPIKLGNRSPEIPIGQLSSDASRLFILFDGTLFDFDTTTGREIRRIPIVGMDPPILISPDGKLLVSTHHPRDPNGNPVQKHDPKSTTHPEDVIVTLQEYPSLNPLQQFTVPMAASVRLAFSPDSQFLAYSANRGHTIIELMNLMTGQVTKRISEVPHFIQLQFSPDGTQIASAHSDSTILLWDLTKFFIRD